MCGGQCGGAEFGEELNEKHVAAVKNHSFWEGLKGQVVLRGLRSRIEAIRHR